MKKNLSHPDYVLTGVSAALIALGVLILATVSAPLSLKEFQTTNYFLKHQLVYGLIPGLVLGCLAFKISLSFLKKWSSILLLINLIFLCLVFFPTIGSSLGGASRWVHLGPVFFQPSEFLKLTFVFYLAAWLSNREQKSIVQKKYLPAIKKALTTLNKNFPNEFNKNFIAFLTIIGSISLFLIFQPDISTLGVIALIAALMYFSAHTPVWHSVLIILLGIGGLISLIKLAPYRAARLLVFLKPETDPMGMGYQIKQALISVGSGGILGKGLGMSRQKFGLLPQPMSDSTFAVFAEETGFIGSLILIFLFLLFLWQSFKILRKSQNQFLQLTVLGISSWIVIQAFINIGSIIGILPLTGIPLPFISYGGSHLVAELIGLGILLNISKQTS